MWNYLLAAPNSLFGSPRKSRPTQVLRSPSLILYQHKCGTTCLTAPHLLTSSIMNTKHRSPAKKSRNSKRLIKFLQSKISCKDLPNLVICSQPSISLVPLRPKLSSFKPPSTSVPPIPPPVFSSTCVQTSYPSLSQVKNEGINIRPRKIYHPSIINACLALFKKHPDLLAQEEIIKFNEYRAWKKEVNDPLESNPVYLPIGGLRRCLVCENLT